MPNPSRRESPFDRHAQYRNRRTALLSEAARLFNAQGSGATTLKQVAAELNLTKTSLYYYVKNKQDLIYQCYSENCDYFLRLLDDCRHVDGAGVDQLRHYITENILVWREIKGGRHPHIAILDSNDALPPGMREDIARRYKVNFDDLVDIIRRGIDDRSISACDPVFLAVAINGAITWLPRWLGTLTEPEIESVCAATCNIFFNGVASDAGDYRLRPLQFEHSVDEVFPPCDKDALQQRKHDAFLLAGTQMFNMRGYENTSLEDISESLGVTKGAFYYHVDSKPELLRQCVAHSLDLLDRIYTLSTRASTTGVELLEHICRHIFYVQNSEYGPLVRYNVMTHLPAKDWAALTPRVEKLDYHFSECLLRGAKDGSMRAVDTPIFRRIVMGITLSCLNISHWSKREDTIGVQSADYFQWLFNGIATR